MSTLANKVEVDNHRTTPLNVDVVFVAMHFGGKALLYALETCCFQRPGGGTMMGQLRLWTRHI